MVIQFANGYAVDTGGLGYEISRTTRKRLYERVV